MEPNEQPEPTLPSAEQMRARRLAKLASSSAGKPADTSLTSPASGSTAGPGESLENANPTAPSTTKPLRLPANPPTDSPKDSGSNKSKTAQATPPGTVPTKKRSASAINLPASAGAMAPSKRLNTESLEDWTDQTLSSIFRVSLDPSRTKHKLGHQLTFLPDLSEEKVKEGGPLKFTADDIEPAINEAGFAIPNSKHLLTYLLPCWKNVMLSIKQLRDQRPEKVQVLQEAKRLCMSACIFAVTEPGYFGREENFEHMSIHPYLLRGLDQDDSIDLDFITEAVLRMKDDGGEEVRGMFANAIMELSIELSGLTMNDDYQPYVQALVTYSKFNPLIDLIADHPSFILDQATGAEVEKITLLGPFFRLSPVLTEVALKYFSSPRTMDERRIHSSQSAIQMMVTSHQTDLHGIAMAFARAGDVPKNRLLDWLAQIMNVNHKRRAMQVNKKDVSSDGFMMNITAVLDRMCEPFMEASFVKMDRIDIDYLRRRPKVDISDETKLNADQAQSDSFYGNRVPGIDGFTSQVFFMNMAAHHYGSGAAQQKWKDLDREIKHMEKQLAMLEAQLRKYPDHPVVPRQVTLHTMALEKHMAYKMALEGALLDEKMQQRSLMFMRYLAVWLLRVASRTDYTPGKQLTLPLSAEQPEAFQCLPEYALQNIVDNFKFVFRFVPKILPSAVGDELSVLCLAFLESSDYIKNPYLKSSLVSLLYSGTWRLYHLTNGVFGDSLMTSSFANKYLLHALMKFYIECELTGAHNAFYEKFNIRYEIFQVIKVVWPNDVYKQQLTQQSQTNRSFFVQFVNLLLNDATYVLDEALSKFPKISELQKELDENRAMETETRQQKETELQQAESQAQSYMQLANETVAMMKLFTDALSEAFTMPEIVSRLAGMLDYNLATLVGPKSSNLKVADPSKYYFNPRALLPQIIELYLNLGNRTSFIEAVANDGRSYKPETFDAATRIVSARGLLEPDKLLAWNKLKLSIARAKEAADQDELDLGEIPSEFEDPILGDLMKDPVILPSKAVVDRSTIIQHLLSDPKDPFTRQPMTEADIVPHVELREKIQAWKKERIEAARKATADAAVEKDPDAMDTYD